MEQLDENLCAAEALSRLGDDEFDRIKKIMGEEDNRD
jgi:hypothetical protein